MTRTLRRGLRAAAATAVAGLALAGPAAAHIQVSPARVAPDDAVLWQVLVPSERPAGTRRVELQVPKDVLPFSFEASPGWRRTETKNPDGSLATIVWTGSTPGDGLATFRFLASTPAQPGRVAWKALQTYRDGELVRWIGSPDSEHPASLTTISEDAPRANAGGEGDAAEAGTEAPATAAAAPAAGPDDDDEGDPLTLIALAVGVLGLLAGVAGLVTARSAAAR